MPEWLALPNVSQARQQTAFHLANGDFDKQGQGGQNNGKILLVR